jgi:predicted dehydrogenase
MTERTSRRHFLKTAIVASSAPLILRSGLLGAEAPSKVMRVASIGTGRMGLADMKNALGAGIKAGANARVVAVCDCDSKRATHAAEIVRKFNSERNLTHGVEIYGDYRTLLARTDIDAVTISTPDHTHAIIAIEAAKAGKHIYIQKPLTYTVAEGRKLVEAVRRHNVILQTGSQQRSSIYFRQVCTIVRNGWLGKLKSIEVRVPTDKGRANFVAMPVPANLNYDMWSGPAPMIDYTESGIHPQNSFSRPGWLQRERYCRGMITGWGAHMYDIAQWGIGNDTELGPIAVSCKGEFPDRGVFDVHVGYSGTAGYVNGVNVVSSNGSAGVKFIMEGGWAYCARDKMDCSNQELLRRKPTESEVSLYKSTDHMLDFLTSARNGTDPICPVEVGHRTNTVCVLHHISMKLGGRALKWDPVAETILNDPEATAMLDLPARQPWTL